MITTYAHSQEDVILLSCFPDVVKGRYIDLGAGHPVVNSVTKLFYEAGWHGVNVAIDPALYALLAFDRPRDTNLSAEDASLEAICADEFSGDIVHFMRIQQDVLPAVLNAYGWRTCRPEVICVQVGAHSADIGALLKAHEYRIILSDGRNKYYVSQEAAQREASLRSSLPGMNVVPLAVKQQRDIAAKEKELATLHYNAQRVQLAETAKQSQWYETAPLSWMLPRFFKSLDAAIVSRLTRRCYRELTIAAQDVPALSANPNLEEVRSLAATYANGISYDEKRPSKSVEYVLHGLLFGYRIVRKVVSPLKALYKRGRSQGSSRA